MKSILRLALLTVCLLLTLTVVTCSSSDEPEIPVEQGNIDPALVGTWLGTVNGSFGEAEMTMVLKNNGDASGEGSTDLYCPVNAKWEVKASNFIAKGNDECDGSAVTFTAPYSKTRLNGTWSSSVGNNGTFEIEKQ